MQWWRQVRLCNLTDDLVINSIIGLRDPCESMEWRHFIGQVHTLKPPLTLVI